MVGYQKNESLTPNQKLVAGCWSGIMTRFITQPLDIIKIRTQLQQKSAMKYSKRWFGATRRILSEEGITAFWQGHTLGQVHSVLAVSSQFYVYELATKYVTNAEVHENLKPVLMFLCGALAGSCSATIVIPLEVVRLRQMLVKDQYRGLFQGAKAVYKTGGIFSFYEGLTASIMQMGPAVGISFSMFRLVQGLMLSYMDKCNTDDCKRASGNAHKPEALLVASTVAGGIAGFTSKTLTYPFDLAKKRLQIATHEEDKRFQTPSTSKHLVKCSELASCLLKTYKVEGAPGLYRGWKITMYKSQLTSVVAFTTYELTCYALRELGVK